MTYTFSDDCISDLHKDAYGFRPKVGFWTRWASATDAEKQQEWDWLVQVLERSMEEEKLNFQSCIARFEERLAGLLELGAKDTAMAIRWLDEAYQTNGDLEFLEWNLGLPFGHLKTVA